MCIWKMFVWALYDSRCRLDAEIPHSVSFLVSLVPLYAGGVMLVVNYCIMKLNLRSIFQTVHIPSRTPYVKFEVMI